MVLHTTCVGTAEWCLAGTGLHSHTVLLVHFAREILAENWSRSRTRHHRSTRLHGVGTRAVRTADLSVAARHDRLAVTGMTHTQTVGAEEGTERRTHACILRDVRFPHQHGGTRIKLRLTRTFFHQRLFVVLHANAIVVHPQEAEPRTGVIAEDVLIICTPTGRCDHLRVNRVLLPYQTLLQLLLYADGVIGRCSEETSPLERHVGRQSAATVQTTHGVRRTRQQGGTERSRFHALSIAAHVEAQGTGGQQGTQIHRHHATPVAAAIRTRLGTAWLRNA